MAGGSKVSVRIWRAPVTIDMSIPSENPKRWKSGRYIMIVSAGVIARRKARSTRFRTIRWQCIAPLGNPVVPEVYMMKAAASGSTAAARFRRSTSSTCSPARTSALQSRISGRGSAAATTTRFHRGNLASRTSPARAVSSEGASCRTMPR